MVHALSNIFIVQYASCDCLHIWEGICVCANVNVRSLHNPIIHIHMRYMYDGQVIERQCVCSRAVCGFVLAKGKRKGTCQTREDMANWMVMPALCDSSLTYIHTFIHTCYWPPKPAPACTLELWKLGRREKTRLVEPPLTRGWLVRVCECLCGIVVEWGSKCHINLWLCCFCKRLTPLPLKLSPRVNSILTDRTQTAHTQTHPGHL